MTDSFLIFKVQSQYFAINVSHVDNIVQLPKVFQVPQAPDYIMGVINMSGQVIPLINAGTKLNMGEVVSHELSTVIILNSKKEDGKFQQLGFLISEVLDVHEIETTSLQALPTSKFEFDQRYVDGMYKVEDEFAMAINVENFFNGNLNELALEDHLL